MVDQINVVGKYTFVPWNLWDCFFSKCHHQYFSTTSPQGFSEDSYDAVKVLHLIRFTKGIPKTKNYSIQHDFCNFLTRNSIETTSSRRWLPRFVAQAQRVEFVRSVGIRTATETMREQRKREDMALKWRLPGSPVG